MGWIQKCCETYDNNLHMVGKQVEGKTALAPLYCITAKAHLEITLTDSGSFSHASVVEKSVCDTLIPVTEKSASRSGKSVFPHPLCDQLSFVGLGHPDNPGHEQYSVNYAAFMDQLKAWNDSQYTNFIVAAVYEYCRNGTIVRDLANAGIVALDEQGRLDEGKINGTDYEKCLIRWRVQKLGYIGECWLNGELFNSYALFYSNRQNSGESALCYVSGELQAPAAGYPKGIMRAAYGAKILSANDSSGFTYRGRFTNPSEAFSVGAVNSQKAHSALTWITANNGSFYGPRVFVCWNPKGKKVTPFDAELTLFEDDDGDDRFAYTMPQYADRLRKAIAGAKQELGDNEDIVIMAMEAATTGRLSVTYYSELASSDYLKRLENWQLTCCWYRGFKDDDGNYHTVISAPSIKDIIRCSYGTQQNEFISADDALLKEHSQRILHCIVDGASVPHDIVSSIVAKASHRAAYSAGNYERLLGVACALIRKSRNDIIKRNNDSKGEYWTMELDTKCTDRSYVFGRLLAVAEKIERSAYERGENREPAALRLQAAYAAHPMHTWAILEKSLNPYYAKLGVGLRVYYRNLVGELIALLNDASQTKLNMPLEDTYLLGYYLQRRALNTSRTESGREAAEEPESDTNE